MVCDCQVEFEAIRDAINSLVTQWTALNVKLDTLNGHLASVVEHLDTVQTQITATERAYKETGPKTLGDNIQDMRDIQEEGFCRSKDVLRKQGFGKQGDRCEDV